MLVVRIQPQARRAYGVARRPPPKLVCPRPTRRVRTASPPTRAELLQAAIALLIGEVGRSATELESHIQECVDRCLQMFDRVLQYAEQTLQCKTQAQQAIISGHVSVLLSTAWQHVGMTLNHVLCKCKRFKSNMEKFLDKLVPVTMTTAEAEALVKYDGYIQKVYGALTQMADSVLAGCKQKADAALGCQPSLDL